MVERSEDQSPGRQPEEEAVEPAEADLSRLEDAAAPSPADEHVAEMLSHTIDVPALASVVDRQLAADAADTLETLEAPEAVELLERMDDERAAAALSEMQLPLARGVLTDLVVESPEYAGRLMGLMAPDDATDLLQAMEPDDRRRLLTSMPRASARDLVALLHYDEESAGGLMTTDVLMLRDDMTVEQAIDYIRSTTVPEGAQHAFVVDGEERLVGAIGLRRLLLAQPRERIADLMGPSVRVVRPDMDREQVAQEFDRYDYSTLAVVDDVGRLLGMVTVDDVIDIIRAEQTEDVQKTVGAGAGEAVYSTIAEKFRGRFPWLGASLLMTCGAAMVILLFQPMVQQHTILAFLLPVTAALVGNAGHQALAVTLRGIVLDEVRRDRVWPLIAREAVAGAAMGAALGVLVFVMVWLLASTEGDQSSARLGAISGLAAMMSMCVGTLAGSGIPLLMRRIGADPAQSSAIFLIMVTDGVSFTCLLGLTYVLL